MKARFVVLVRNRPCQPNLHSNQILSNIEVMERTRYEGKLHSTRLLLQTYNPTKYYQTISKGTGVMKPTMVYGRTDGRQADRYIPRTIGSGDKNRILLFYSIFVFKLVISKLQVM